MAKKRAPEESDDEEFQVGECHDLILHLFISRGPLGCESKRGGEMGMLLPSFHRAILKICQEYLVKVNLTAAEIYFSLKVST